MKLRTFILKATLVPILRLKRVVDDRKILVSLKKVLFVLMVLLFITLELLANPINSSQRVLLPLDILIVGFDKEINSLGDDLIFLKTLVDLKAEDYFEISNSRLNSNGTWERSFNDFVSYGLRYKGINPIERNSIVILQTETGISSSGQILTITINGVDFSNEFNVVHKSNPSSQSNSFLDIDEEGSIYLHQGSWYTQNDSTKFLGSIIHSLTFSENPNPNLSETNVNMAIVNSNTGRGDFENCDPCLTKAQVQNAANWVVENGTSNTDILIPTQTDPSICDCEGDIVIEQYECFLGVSLNSTFYCSEAFSFDWIFVDELGQEFILFSDIHYGALNTIPLFDPDTSGLLKLKITCGECLKESNEERLDCRGGERISDESFYNQENSSKSFSVYPNPANQSFYLELESLNEEVISLVIYTTEGKKILEKNYPTTKGINQYIIDSSSFSSGVYFIELKENKISLGTNYITIAK